MLSDILNITELISAEKSAHLRFYTLGDFKAIRTNEQIESKQWGRDKTIQLLQFLITNRHRHGLHKEQIIDRIWEDSDQKSGDRDFKVALHGINKVLEPNRESRTETKYVVRSGLSYQLKSDNTWVDSTAFEQAIIIGNDHLHSDKAIAKKAYDYALELYGGIYLPDRVYMDWTSAERERLQVLALGTYIELAKIELETNAFECIRLCQSALQIDHAWEEAYTLQIKANIASGNRPQAIKTYNICVEILMDEYGLAPLPTTKSLVKNL